MTEGRVGMIESNRQARRLSYDIGKRGKTNESNNISGWKRYKFLVRGAVEELGYEYREFNHDRSVLLKRDAR